MEKFINRKRSFDEGHKAIPFNSNKIDSEYQRDRARVIHSAAFRRLQSKTQIIGIGESDFYRTRLTHSLEVAQIGSGICEVLKNKYNKNREYLKWIPPLYLIEAIGLVHDIGHPPFGHGGEIALNYVMRDKGGFEGNGHTLRIISKLGEFSPHHGLDLTRRTMLGVLKYPALYSTIQKSYDATDGKIDTNTINIDSWKPPKCLMDDEKEVFSWILDPFSVSDKKEFVKLTEKGTKTKYKCLDATIMELADDISYGVHDLEDALELKLISQKNWEDDVLSKLSGIKENDFIRDIKFYNECFFSESSKKRKQAVSRIIRYLLASINIKKQHVFEHPLLDCQAEISSPQKDILNCFKTLVKKAVIYKPEVQALRFKGQQIILKLFEALNENPDKLLPKNTYEKYKQEEQNKKRVICDYIAGMTDIYSAKLYHRMFSPNMGSIFDRL